MFRVGGGDVTDEMLSRDAVVREVSRLAKNGGLKKHTLTSLAEQLASKWGFKDVHTFYFETQLDEPGLRQIVQESMKRLAPAAAITLQEKEEPTIGEIFSGSGPVTKKRNAVEELSIEQIWEIHNNKNKKQKALNQSLLFDAAEMTNSLPSSSSNKNKNDKGEKKWEEFTLTPEYGVAVKYHRGLETVSLRKYESGKFTMTRLKKNSFSVPVDVWKALCNAMPQINAAVVRVHETVMKSATRKRPTYE